MNIRLLSKALGVAIQGVDLSKELSDVLRPRAEQLDYTGKLS